MIHAAAKFVIIIDSKKGFRGSVLSYALADLMECPQDDGDIVTELIYSS